MLLDPLDLYDGFECDRVHSLGDLAIRLGSERR
jgi:hypothetical protein